MNNITRTLYLGTSISHRNLLRKNLYQVHRSIRKITSAETAQVVEIKLNEVLSNVEPRIERRKPQIQPFMLEVFAGKFNKDLLAFPEILNKDELEEMANHIKSIHNFTLNEKSTTDDFSAFLKNIKMYSAPATVFHGGFATNTTERCKFLETISHDVQAALRIKNHWVGMNCLINGLSQEDQDRIIPELATGKVPINILTAENISNDPNGSDINCKARVNVKGEWKINGEKLFSGEMSKGYFIVLCSIGDDVLQPFLIHPKAIGIDLKESSITFKNTPATLLGRKFGENTTSDYKKAILLLTNALSQNRLDTAAIAVGHLRHFITTVIQHLRNKYVNGSPYSDLPLIQNSITEAVSTLYASESMVYFTAGLQDGYENPKTEIEMTLCKIFVTKRTFEAITGTIEILGSNGLPPKIMKFMDDAKILLLSDEPTQKLNTYIAMCGLQHVGQSISDTVQQGRNPFKYPLYTIKKLFKDRDQINDRPKLTLFLKENLHPSMQETADLLEYSVLRFKYASEVLLFRYGAECLNEHRQLERLAIIAAQIYASTASVSRASRAYCIGLHMGANEMVVSAHITWSVKKLVGNLVQEIYDDYILNRDHFRGDIAEKSLKYGTSHYEHCLERVFF